MSPQSLPKLPQEVNKLITNEINLEIMLKHKELELAQAETQKIQDEIRKLQQVITDPEPAPPDPRPQLHHNNPFHHTYDHHNPHHPHHHVIPPSHPQRSGLSLAPAQHQQDPNATHYRTRSTTSGCLYQRADGVIVKITCPDCQRSNFLSVQGFLNHCRIAHAKDYMSQEAAAQQCGEVIDYDMPVPVSSTPNAYTYPVKEKRSQSPPTTTPNNANTAATASTPAAKSNELLKKLIKQGKMDKSKFEALVSETKQHVLNAHLFDGEVDDDNDDDRNEAGEEQVKSGVVAKDSSPGDGGGGDSSSHVISPNRERKRRQSRGGINIKMDLNGEDAAVAEDDEVESPQEKKLKK
ncbi:uncharacterized protein LODBEIA_P19860 [Lodderomyces beijingensis]|uniref:AHC1-like C2H2 zinc-finger domain-containing protein n=1 Tax=Lodderomyces beijingensis TaxID=1775926 RepID=A0ABP0ZK15_9ASCO